VEVTLTVYLWPVSGHSLQHVLQPGYLNVLSTIIKNEMMNHSVLASVENND
jgi:hypothetical protein